MSAQLNKSVPVGLLQHWCLGLYWPALCCPVLCFLGVSILPCPLADLPVVSAQRLHCMAPCPLRQDMQRDQSVTNQQ